MDGAPTKKREQITAENVGRLKRAWVYHTGEMGNFETTPIVVDHVMYFSTQAQKIVARCLLAGCAVMDPARCRSPRLLRRRDRRR